MNQEQTLEVVEKEALLEKVRELRAKGYRLVQIGAVRLPDAVEITYSFDLNGRLANLRVRLDPTTPRVPSISSIYGCAVLYENEIHDLFKVQVDGMALDFQGNFYKTTVKFPFGTVKAPAKPAAKPAAAQATPAKAAPAQAAGAKSATAQPADAPNPSPAQPTAPTKPAPAS